LEAFDTCLRVGCDAKRSGGKITLGAAYDEVVRRQLERQASLGARDTDLRFALTKVDRDLVERAHALVEQRVREKAIVPLRSFRALCVVA